MEFSISKKSLRLGLNRVQSVAARKSTTPILTGVYLVAEGARITLATTDGAVAITTVVPATVVHEGGVVVSVRELADLTKNLPDELVTFTVGEDCTVGISCGQVTHKLHGHPSANYPELPVRPTELTPVSLDAGLVRELVACTHYAVSRDTAWHPDLCNVLFEGVGECVRMVATDSQRISVAEHRLHGADLSFRVPLPVKFVRELYHLLTVAKKGWQPWTVNLALGDEAVFFWREDFALSVTLPKVAPYPDHTKVIPKTTDRIVTLNRVLFVDAIKRATDGKANRSDTGRAELRLSLTPSNLHVASLSATATSSTNIAVSYEGTPLTIGMDGTYLLDALTPLPSDKITLGLSGELDPCVIRPVQEYVFIDFTGVVMPIRL